MAKTKISEFSATPGNNTDIDGINIAEGCAPSGINDAIRELMAQLKDWQAGTSNDPYVVGSSGSLTLSYGTANGVPYLNGSKVVTSGSALTFDGTNFATTGSVTSAGSSNSGNLAFTGTGNRITGDFSNATFANRVAFQTSTANSATTVYAIPNGSSTISGFIASTDPAVTNGSEVRVLVTGTAATITSSFRGSGTTLPLTFDVGGERMRVDTSGNVGIGTSSGTRKLNVYGGASGTRTMAVVSNASEGLEIGVNASNIAAVNSAAGGAIIFTQADTERARIDSSGNLLVGTTSSSFGEKLSVQSTASNTNIAYLNYTFTDDRSNTVIQHSRATGATSATMILFRNASSSQVGSISSTGSATTYTTSSDYRLKENIAPMTGALATVTKLNPVTYTWKDGGFSGQGFIAHELQAVVPDAVVGEKDAVDAEGNPVYQGIDTSFLVATLTAAIQEQQAIITALTARVTALESN